MNLEQAFNILQLTDWLALVGFFMAWAAKLVVLAAESFNDGLRAY